MFMLRNFIDTYQEVNFHVTSRFQRFLVDSFAPPHTAPGQRQSHGFRLVLKIIKGTEIDFANFRIVDDKYLIFAHHNTVGMLLND